MDILEELEEFINDFNQHHDEDFKIDSVRIEFQKQYKQKELKKLGNWNKIKKNSNILFKLKKRLTDNQITSVWRLENHNIYYYNMQDPPKYRKAILVIFGMEQYHKEPPPRAIISKVLSILKNVSNIDVCSDLPYKPNIKVLSEHFKLTPYITKKGIITDTNYINDTGILMIDKVTIYDKAYKNNLKGTLWRIEAKINIPNFKVLALPLHEFKEIVDSIRNIHD